MLGLSLALFLYLDRSEDYVKYQPLSWNLWEQHFYGVRTWRLCQYFLKKSGMYGNGGLLAACGLGYQWCPLLLFLNHSPVLM